MIVLIDKLIHLTKTTMPTNSIDAPRAERPKTETPPKIPVKTDGQTQATATLTLKNELGMDPHAIARVARVAEKFKSTISFIISGRTIPIKDKREVFLMEMLAKLHAGQGESIIVTAEGADADAAVQAMEQLFSKDFSV